MLWNAVRHCLLSRLRPDLGASVFFFFNDTATTEIYTLSLHDALPISARAPMGGRLDGGVLRLSPRERADPAAALPRPGELRGWRLQRRSGGGPGLGRSGAGELPVLRPHLPAAP